MNHNELKTVTSPFSARENGLEEEKLYSRVTQKYIIATLNKCCGFFG